MFWTIDCDSCTVTTAQLQHRVPCFGYVFDEKAGGLPDQALGSTAPAMPMAAGTALSAIAARTVIKRSAGAGAAANMTVTAAQQAQQQGRRVVILGDTMDSRCIAPAALNADLLVHEATFMEGMEDRAYVAQHSTAWMAGQFAHAIQAKHLVLSHFSARYNAGRMSTPKYKTGPTRARPLSEISVKAEVDEQGRELAMLLNEAEAAYKKDTVFTARDFFTFHVPFTTQP